MQHVYCGRLYVRAAAPPIRKPLVVHQRSDRAALERLAHPITGMRRGPWREHLAHSLGICLKYGKPTASSTWHAVMCSLSGIPLECPQYSSNRADLCTHLVR